MCGTFRLSCFGEGIEALDLRKREKPILRLLAGHMAFSVLIVLCLLVVGCGARRPTVAFDIDPGSPFPNQSVHFVDHSTDPDGPADLISWEWKFGDGATASGPDVWHQYRSINEGGEWIVKLTVTDTQGNRGVRTKSVQMQPTTSQLVGYYMQCAGTRCTDIEQSRPAIPTSCYLPFQQEDVLTGWWLAPTKAPFYLLAKLHYVLSKVDKVRCTWSLYFRGMGCDEPPKFVMELGQDERVVDHSHFYCLGFPVEISPEEEMTQRGWYQVFAEVSSPDGTYRNFIDFMLCVGGEELS